jgi:hypothetical protein
MKKIKFNCLIGALLLCFTVNAQHSVIEIDSLAGKTVTTLRLQSKEKILLQTDRKVFAAGEKIWFKAYLVKALDNHMDSSSKSLFVDLVNDSDRVIKQLVLNAVAMRTNGMIQLGDSLPAGYYWLRGYTQKMVKQDTESIAVLPLYVINTQKPQTGAKAANTMVKGSFKVNFYPEGGTLITGLTSTGALQVQDENGNPVVTTGAIVNAQDSVITNFTTNRFGLARISFYPKWFQRYQMVVHGPNGQDIKYPLQAWDPFAAQISVIKQSKDELQTYITLEDSIYTRKYTTYLLAISKDSVCFAGIGRGMCEVDIPLKDFPGGVATLLLFNEDKQLVSERDVFINKDNFTLNVTPDKASYTTRDKANLSVEVTGSDGKPLVAALSVSVEDNRVMQMSDKLETDTLQPAGLALNDWLTKYKSTLNREEIDLLMLAHAPRFKNMQASAQNANQPFIDNNDLLLYLKGRVLDEKGKPQAKKIITEITRANNTAYFDVDTTGIGGGFRLNMPENKDNMLLMLQVTNKRGTVETDDYMINVDTFNFPKFATPVSLKNRYSLSTALPLVKEQKFHIDSVFVGIGKEWLKTVTVKTKAKKQDTYNTSKRVSDFSHIISSDMISRGGYETVGNMVLMVQGVNLKNGFVSVLGGAGFGSSPKTEPILIIDGVRVPIDTTGIDQKTEHGELIPKLTVGNISPVLQFLNTLNPAEIDFIEVLSGPEAAAFGTEGGNGAIVVNTRSRADYASRGPNGLKILFPKTYHSAPAFTMPDYSTKDLKNSKEPDNRNTIYWNGNIVTDVAGKSTISFYTADAATTYSVVITGITANGDYVYKRISLNRK